MDSQDQKQKKCVEACEIKKKKVGKGICKVGSSIIEDYECDYYS